MPDARARRQGRNAGNASPRGRAPASAGRRDALHTRGKAVTDPVVVTGAAGFIGYHAARRLLSRGVPVVGVDSFAANCDPKLTEDRFAELLRHDAFVPVRLDLTDAAATRALFERHAPRQVLHLAAQAGVRRSLVDPVPYVATNVAGFLNVLEACRHVRVEHLVYASSSSVYGANRKLPFAVGDPVDHPVSLYAATKKADELMAHAYSHLFDLPTTGLRFFTVYGPWGRPDMAVFKFTDLIARGQPIQVANRGEVWRDFTYVDDVVEGALRVLGRRPPRDLASDPAWDPARPDPARGAGPYRIYNIGNDRSEKLDRLIELIEIELGRKAVRVHAPLPPGDLVETRADISDLRRDIGFAPSTPLEDGVKRFVAWYRQRYG